MSEREEKCTHESPSNRRASTSEQGKDIPLTHSSSPAHYRHNNTFAAEIAANVSSKKRIAILEKAKVLGVKVTNADARVRAVEA